MWSGPCLGGPMDTVEGVSRYPSGFLFVDRSVTRAWVYDRIPWIESPTGDAFLARTRRGAELNEDPDSPRNRWRTAEEAEYDIRVPVTRKTPLGRAESVAPGLHGVYRAIAQWEAVFTSSAFCGNPFDSDLDMSMSEEDLILVTRRFMVVWSDLHDVRRDYLGGFAGWPGTGDALYWDFDRGQVHPAGNHHQWHFLVDVGLCGIGDPVAYDAIVSIALGESSETWENR